MLLQPLIIKGNRHQDERGTLTFNNDFSAFGVKRFYTIENASLELKRAWQGHRVEQRWCSAIVGSFEIKLVDIDQWENPSKDLPVLKFILTAETLDVLHIPAGFATSIQGLEKDSKLLLFADYQLGELQDEFRFPSDYFADN